MLQMRPGNGPRKQKHGEKMETRKHTPAPRYRETAAGFTDLAHTRRMVRCDYCQRLCRRTGISGHKQHCGGWRMQYEGGAR